MSVPCQIVSCYPVCHDVCLPTWSWIVFMNSNPTPAIYLLTHWQKSQHFEVWVTFYFIVYISFLIYITVNANTPLSMFVSSKRSFVCWELHGCTWPWPQMFHLWWSRDQDAEVDKGHPKRLPTAFITLGTKENSWHFKMNTIELLVKTIAVSVCNINILIKKYVIL